MSEILKAPFNDSQAAAIASESVLQNLATEEEVAELAQLYESFFAVDTEGAQETRETTLSLALPIPGADFGVEIEAAMTLAEVEMNLGLVNGLPFLFNTTRRSNGENFWDFPLKPEEEDGAGEVEDFRLHQHQLNGVHAVIRQVFHKQISTDACHGVLNADEVGLGKTLQSIAVCALLIDAVNRQQTGAPLPPLIGECISRNL